MLQLWDVNYYTIMHQLANALCYVTLLCDKYVLMQYLFDVMDDGGLAVQENR